MAKKPDELNFEIWDEEKVLEKAGATGKAQDVRKIAQRFIDPQTKQSIAVGKAVRVGPFDDEAEGRNWIAYYIPDVYRELKWNDNKTDKNQRVYRPVLDPDPDGKIYYLIIRLV